MNERHRFKPSATSADHGLQFLNASEVHQIIKCIISADRKCFVQRRVTVSVTMSFKYMFNNNNTNTITDYSILSVVRKSSHLISTKMD